MADTFTIVQSYEDVEFLGGTATQKVQVVGAVTTGHGIYFETRVPLTAFQQTGAHAAEAVSEAYAAIFETIAAEPFVVGVQWGQQTFGGSLQDVAIVTVASTSGNSTSSFTVPTASLGPKLTASQVATLHKQLDDQENL